MIKPTKKVIAADENSNSVKFYFQEYQKGATYYNNGTRIDFVTDGKALYVCAIDTVVTTADKIEDQPNLLKILAEGKPGRDGVKGERGLPGETPTISARFDGTQMIIYADGRRIATSTDLVGPSWKPKLVGNTITWEKTRSDESPKPIDLDDLKPDDYKPILLRTNSDNTKRSDEESGPANFIQWKYEGDAEWNNLISISELMNLTLAGVSIWKSDEDGKWHFGHKEVINARYTATHEGRQIISEVELGDVLYDAGPIPMVDYGADIALINAKLDELQNAINRIPEPYELTAEKIADALGYVPGHEVDLNNIKLKIDNNKMLQISRDGGRNWEEVGITCECNVAETTGVPVFRVFVDGKQYNGTDYQIRIEGVGTYNATDSMPILNIGQEYVAYAIKDGYESSSIKFTFNKSDVRLDLTKIDGTVYYTVNVVCSPSEASVTVDGKPYVGELQVVAGTTIEVAAYLDGYKDYRKSYTISRNETIRISLEEIVPEEDTTYCAVTIASITPSGAKVYYGQEEVHVGETFNVAKGSSMHFKGDAVSGYKALDKDYRIYYADTQNIDIVFDPVEEIDLDGYYNVTINCNVSNATITVNATSGKDPLVINGSVTEFYLLESIPQTIKVKNGVLIVTNAIADGYYSAQSVDTITSDTTINLKLDLKSKEYYGDRYLIFRDLKDENGNVLDPSDAKLILQGESGETGAQSEYDYADIINKPIEVSGPWRVTAIVRKPGYKNDICYEGIVEGNVDVYPVLKPFEDSLSISFLKYFNNGSTDYIEGSEIWTDDSNVTVYMGKNNVNKGYQIYVDAQSSGTMWVEHSDLINHVDAYKEDGSSFATTSFDNYAIFGIFGHSSAKGEVGTVTITARENEYNTSPVIGEVTIHIRNDYEEALEPTVSISSEFVNFPAAGGDQESGINYLYFASMPEFSVENENGWFNAEVYPDGTRNMLKVTAYENTGAAREGTFKLIATYDGTNPLTDEPIHQVAELELTISQEGASVVPVEVESVSLNKSTLSLEVGNTETLSATVLPSNADQSISWSSSDPSVATVSNGLVTAVAEGNATITATAGSKSATCEVTVTESEEPEPTKYTVSWEDDSDGDEAPANYDVKVNGIGISNGEEFEEGSEISITLDYDETEYYAPEIHINNNTDAYTGVSFTLNENVVCLIKWIKKALVSTHKATCVNAPSDATVYMKVNNGAWNETEEIADLNDGDVVSVYATRPDYKNLEEKTKTIDGASVVFDFDTYTWETDLPWLDFNVTPTNLTLAGDGTEKGEISITGDVNWTVSNTTSWVTVTPSSGTGNGTIEISVSENETGDTRDSDWIYITTEDHANPNSFSVIVTQPAIVEQKHTVTIHVSGENVPVHVTSIYNSIGHDYGNLEDGDSIEIYEDEVVTVAPLSGYRIVNSSYEGADIYVTVETNTSTYNAYVQNESSTEDEDLTIEMSTDGINYDSTWELSDVPDGTTVYINVTRENYRYVGGTAQTIHGSDVIFYLYDNSFQEILHTVTATCVQSGAKIEMSMDGEPYVETTQLENVPSNVTVFARYTLYGKEHIESLYVYTGHTTISYDFEDDGLRTVTTKVMYGGEDVTENSNIVVYTVSGPDDEIAGTGSSVSVPYGSSVSISATYANTEEREWLDSVTDNVTVTITIKKSVPESIAIDEPDETTDNVYSLYARFAPESFNEVGANVPNLTWSVSTSSGGNEARLTNVNGQSAELEITDDCYVTVTVNTAPDSIAEFGELSASLDQEFVYHE